MKMKEKEVGHWRDSKEENERKRMRDGRRERGMEGKRPGGGSFLLDINDISNIFDTLHTILFADDSTFYMVGENPTQLNNKTNTELIKFSNWCLANKLTVNTSKTH